MEEKIRGMGVGVKTYNNISALPKKPLAHMKEPLPLNLNF